MPEEENIIAEEIVAEAPAAAPALSNRPVRGGRGGVGGARPGGRGGERRSSARAPRARSEFDQKMIAIRRVARVVAGGRRFSFSAAIIIGNKKGKVGVGLGKAGDTTLAIDKATRDAKKNMLTIPLSKEGSI